MKHTIKVVISLILWGSWSCFAYSESKIENIACTSKQKIDELSAEFRDKKIDKIESALPSGCVSIENNKSIFIEKTNGQSKIFVFFGEDRIELFVDENFSVIK